MVIVKGKPKKAFNFVDYIDKHDYTGAMTILQHGSCEGLSSADRLLWIGYCLSRLHEFSRAKEVYEELLSAKQKDALATDDRSNVGLYLAITNFYMGCYDEAEQAALSVTDDSELKNRILLSIARATDDETKVAKYRQYLNSSKEDELSAAATELYRCHHKETADIYEKMLSEGDDLALNVYLAICYFKMDCFDLSLEALDTYSKAFPDSAIAANIKACNVFKLCDEDGTSAMEVIDTHCDENDRSNDLIQHNTVVYEGQRALKVLPDLVGKVPEARLNLASYFLRNNEVEAAAELLNNVDTNTPQAHVLLGILKTKLGQAEALPESLAEAQAHFHQVGNSPMKCDTIIGRQSMASSLILLKEYEDALVYLESIKTYLENDDVFNWNYGIALAALERYDEALEALLNVCDLSFKSDLAYIMWLAKCYIMTGQMKKAWECLDTEDHETTYQVLQLLANECYKLGGHNFLYSSKAFKELFEIDKFPDYLNGLTGACVGFFRHFIAKNQDSRVRSEDENALEEVIEMLESANSPKCRSIVKTIQRWKAHTL
eukprot:scaffold148878_cov24-Cyclotella_meneghiniana.AAC.1